MADVKISGLPASTTPLAGTEVLPIVQSGVTKQVSVANLTAGRAIGATNATFTGALNVTPTWNAGATTFTGLGLNVTDTASAAGSLLLDLQVGGTSQFKARKGGTVSVASGNATTPSYGIGDAGLGLYSRASVRLNFATGGFDTGVEIGPNVFALASTATINWTAGALPSSGIDLILARDDAGILAQRDGTNAQTHRWYRSFTNSSNYSRVSLGWSSSTAILATEGLGTGTRGNIAFGTAALATNATVGYVMIPSCDGAPTGVPADIPTGQVAMHYDSTNNRIYVYNGAWRMIAVV